MMTRGSMKWLVPGAMVLSLGACMTGDADGELGSAEQEVKAGKRTICHYNGQGVPHEITISENAVPAHFANHGDHDLISFYPDDDGDGFGAGDAILACTQPGGTSTTDDDCDDADGSINPGAAEVCGDNTDNNCDGALAQAQAVKLLDFQGQVFDGSFGQCSDHANVTMSVCRETPTQQILIAGNATATAGAYFDEIGVTVVTSPGGTVRGANYIFFEANCRNAAFGNRNFFGARSLIDATDLFGTEFGQFEINLRVPNAFQPYSYDETWVVPVN